MIDPALHPQNPYRSYVIKASAGSGKTYQLSRRFLSLVAAHADPAAILTITFTRKAAAEMRQRILQDAALLLHDAAEQANFEHHLLSFFRWAQMETVAGKFLRPPLSAAAVGKLILEQSQLLRIATIDRIFLQWMRQFPFDAGWHHEADGSIDRWEISDQSMSQHFDEMAWQRLFNDHAATPQWLLQEDIFDTMRKTRELNRYCGNGRTAALWGEHPLPPGVDGSISEKSDSEWLELQKSLLLNVAAQLKSKRQDVWLSAIHSNDLEALLEHRFLKADLTFHGQSVQRSRLADPSSYDRYELQRIGRSNFRKLKQLNQQTERYAQLFTQWFELRQKLKQKNGNVEFDDVLAGAIRIMTDVDSGGARYAIQLRLQHLLLDEFQDTSRPQWQIFSSLCEEILAGEGIHSNKSVIPTCFIVGDSKQSIYGFREADPEILDDAVDLMEVFAGGVVSLDASYRSAQIILDFVNAACAELSDFSSHATACHSDGNLVVTDSGAVGLLCTTLSSTKRKDVVTQEATQLAQAIADMLQQAHNFPVLDAKTQKLRPLQLSDIAILYRQSTHVENLELALREQGLRYKRDEGAGFFFRSECQDVIAMLRWLLLPDATGDLVTLLRSPLIKLPAHKLWALCEAKSNDPSTDLWGLLKNREPLLAERLESLKLQAHVVPLTQLISLLWERYGLDLHYSLSYPEIEQPQIDANLKKLKQLLLVLAQQEDAISFCAKLEELMLSNDDGLAPIGQEAIQLMTIHKSKGLEFACVILMGCHEQWLKSDRYWVRYRSSRHESRLLFHIGNKDEQPEQDAHFEALLNKVRQEQRDENQRLLYVALTRARHYLILSGCEDPDAKTKPELWSQLQEAFMRCDGDVSNLGGGVQWKARGLETVFLEKPVVAAMKELRLEISPSVAGRRPFMILRPHALQSAWAQKGESQQAGALVSAASTGYERIAGLFIHKLLELKSKNLEFNAVRIWAYLLASENMAADPPPTLFNDLMQECYAVFADPWWQNLQSEFSLYPEWSFAYRENDALFRGIIDLVAVDDRRKLIYVIDYKTNQWQGSEQVIRQACEELGYFQQLQAYMKAVQSGIDAGWTIRGWIYLTKLRKVLGMGPKAHYEAERTASFEV